MATRHATIDRLHSRVQNLTDLMVQAQYNASRGLPVTTDEGVADKTTDEQVRRQSYLSCVEFGQIPSVLGLDWSHWGPQQQVLALLALAMCQSDQRHGHTPSSDLSF